MGGVGAGLRAAGVPVPGFSPAVGVAPAGVGGPWLMGALPFSPGVVAVAGSRSLPPEASTLVAAVAVELVAGGCSLIVGCCAGADAAVLAALTGAGGCAASAPLRVLCAWGPGGAGAGPTSAVGAVARSCTGKSAGSVVGGRRSLGAALGAARAAHSRGDRGGLCRVCGVPRLAGGGGSGSWLAASAAVARSLPVVAFPLGFPAAALPELGVGVWAPVGGAGVWAEA